MIAFHQGAVAAPFAQGRAAILAMVKRGIGALACRMFSAPEQPLRASIPTPWRVALYMVGACLVWSFLSWVVRDLSRDLHAFELVFFRNLFGFAAIAPFLFRHGIPAFPRREIGIYLIRGAFGLVAMLGWFYAITVVPLADATALSFTAPIFATITAIVLLGEVVRVRRWTAMLVGFAGAMIVLRPGELAIGIGEIAVLVSSAAIAVVMVMVKILARTETSDRIVAFHTLILLPLSLLAAAFVWTWPTWPQLGLCVALGAAASLANWLTVRAFTLGDTAAVMPYDFTRLPFMALVGYFAFAEVPDVWTWIGGAVIFASALYIARREAQLARARSAAADRES